MTNQPPNARRELWDGLVVTVIYALAIAAPVVLLGLIFAASAYWGL